MGEDETAVDVRGGVVGHLGLDREAARAQRGRDPIRLTAVHVHLHGMAAVAFGLELAAVAGVEGEQQDPTGAQHAVELGEDGG